MIHLKNYADTEDRFQTVFLKYVLSSAAFENEEHEKAWFIRVTINACKDLLRNFFHSHVTSLDEIWEHLRRRKQKAHVCIAITASHVLPDWMWGLLINIMIWHLPEMIWLNTIMQVLIKRRKTVYNVDTVIPVVRSMLAKWRGWKRSESILENDSAFHSPKGRNPARPGILSAIFSIIVSIAR